MATVSLRHINKKYENGFQAVYDFNLEIADKEFIVFVGPSGCGKSTTLRMIAGLEDISSGELYINDRLCNDVTPKDRDIAMVFQSYALYPHMSVYENIAFGLRIRKMPADEIDRRVKHAAEVLEITSLLDRKPAQMSGGQRQRVALGRAIVRNPQVMLMDEPLSNLDAKLRVQMRSEIIKLHEELQTTTIYVTHDQTEAMTMASRIVVMKDGYIQQIGTPRDIYLNPVNMFVAGFVGSPSMNFIKGFYDNGSFVEANMKFKVPGMFEKALKPYHGKPLILGIRPEDLHMEAIVAETFPKAPIDFTVDVAELLGHEYILHGLFGDQPLIAKVPARNNVEAHQVIKLAMDAAKLHFFDADSEACIV
ncbi:MAG: sn-glycerol-3-phosphate ABC transporter ATP-binding protein UgpC [Erysipelotrichaceae bacterium]|jgi:multiple sugar transport system ATP-binding protein|nr:sn-glycerol-3-phosphate ABC transporter ATP-binding protein UgpC [Erysipelotrichaceae bacterium]